MTCSTWNQWADLDALGRELACLNTYTASTVDAIRAADPDTAFYFGWAAFRSAIRIRELIAAMGSTTLDHEDFDAEQRAAQLWNELLDVDPRCVLTTPVTEA